MPRARHDRSMLAGGVRLLAMALLVAAGPQARGGEAPATDLKAAYAYNFIVLSTWPAELPPVMRFCVAGAAADAVAFNVLAGKTVRERTLSVTSVASPDRVADCQVLYLPPESKRVRAWIAAAAGRPILTISDQADEAGAIVNMRLVGRQIVFDLDTGAAAAARIQLSSQLIKLAASRR